jgi:hypothetical protein
MIFSTKSAYSVEKKDIAFLEGGIHENVAFVNVRKERSTGGNLFLEFEFEKNGAKLTHTEWEPNKRPEDTDDEFASKANNQVARILQIIGCFYEKEQLENYTFSQFDELYSWVKSLMDAVDKTKLLRLKVIYGATGYTSLPKYAKYTFIESMDIPTSESKIKQLGIDVFTRPEIGDKEPATATAANTFSTTANAIPVNSSLPF